MSSLFSSFKENHSHQQMLLECLVVVQCTLEERQKYSFEDVLKIILADHPQETFCVKQPMRCRKDVFPH